MDDLREAFQEIFSRLPKKDLTFIYNSLQGNPNDPKVKHALEVAIWDAIHERPVESQKA
jgi:hypothetical protein